MPFSPLSLLSGARIEAFPSTSPTWWTFDATSGFGNPKTDAADSYLIDASPEAIALSPPPGWARTKLSPVGLGLLNQPGGPGIFLDSKGVPLPLGMRKWDFLYVDLEHPAGRSD
ncbi:hypothetical protein DL93DRAFT_2230792, partial [Clavulina sp. PMI_390]